MAPLRSSLAVALLLVAGALLASHTDAWTCPKKKCDPAKLNVDTLDFLDVSAPIAEFQNQTLDTPAKCAAACPCQTGYFAFYRAFNPIKFYCKCYKHCTGTFKAAAELGQRGSITHGYINCTKTCHDPHFIGAHGTRFDFNGKLDTSFCLVSDRAMHLNALFKGYEADNTAGASVTAQGKGLRSWMGELGLLWVDAAGAKHSLQMVARPGAATARGSGFVSSLVLDGAAVGVPAVPGESLQAAGLVLTFLGTFENEWGLEEDKFILSVEGKMEMALHVGAAMPAFQLPTDALVHFSLSIHALHASPAVHGVLGQTYRTTGVQLLKAVKYSALSHLLRGPVQADGASGLGFLDGAMTDYISSSTISADCGMSAFM